MSYRSSSVSAVIASFEIFGGGSSRCCPVSNGVNIVRGTAGVQPYLNFFWGPSNIQGQRMPKSLVVKQAMVPIPSTATIEAVEAHVQARDIILENAGIRQILQMKLREYTKESKH